MAAGESYVELRAATAFSFLRGASSPEELVARAAELGYTRLAITDRNGLHGIVRAHRAAKEHGLRVIVGTEVSLDEPIVDGEGLEPETLILLPTDRAAYGRLARMLSDARLRVGKGGFSLAFEDLERAAQGQFAIHVGTPSDRSLAREHAVFGDRLSLAVGRMFSPFDRSRLEAAQRASVRHGIPLVVTGGVLMHAATRKPLLDILTCIRLGLRLSEAGRRLVPNSAGHLRSPQEMRELFAELPEALARTVEIADACTFSLAELRHRFAIELLPNGESPMSYLKGLVGRGASERYPEGVPEDVARQISHELDLIERLDFAGYFLTVWDIVRYARSRGILCQGRGSAANSVVCYVLGITAIDPVRMSLLFERFISIERGEPPDIDVDFEHERREEVMQYVYEKYGREHAALVATVITYRARSAFREVGKVFGLSEDQLDKLSNLSVELSFPNETHEIRKQEEDARNWVYVSDSPVTSAELLRSGLDPADETVQQVIYHAQTLRGLPRHLGQHTGGFLITRDPIVEMVPIENAAMIDRTVAAWDKDDIEALGFFKIDLLSLGMLSALRKTLDLVRSFEGVELTLATIPAEDPLVYDMISDADTIGTFQVESRAQMQTLPKLRPRTFYDIVVSVAIIRPGPIQGDMVHPYLRRRRGEEPVEYPHPALRDILGKTYGVPLFQEQVMKMAIAVAGFTGGEADELRRAIGWRSKIHIDRLRERLVRGMLERGIDEAYAERIFKMIQGFGGYGFPESHAASFALLGYCSCYLKRYHPAAFLAALLDSQPMGFYSPNVLVKDAERHGVEVRPVSVTHSFYSPTLEPPDEAAQAALWGRGVHGESGLHTPWMDRELGRTGRGRAIQPAVRLGLSQIRGISEAEGLAIVRARSESSFVSIADFAARTKVKKSTLSTLATAGAFAELEDGRRAALWKTLTIDPRSPLFVGTEPKAPLPKFPSPSAAETLALDYETTGLSVDSHPMSLLRDRMRKEGALGFRDLGVVPSGMRVKVGGLVITRQRPGTASGVVFITLADEHGHMNVIVFPKVLERFRREATEHALLFVEGRLQREGQVTNVIAERIQPIPAEGPEPKARHAYFVRYGC
ncbi:MAG: error-prone DNA polymerase [Deltaproteobacteria bacterium]|nr:error-prone DNA polymerase [Deltaproteobacteria bacterium]